MCLTWPFRCQSVCHVCLQIDPYANYEISKRKDRLQVAHLVKDASLLEGGEVGKCQLVAKGQRHAGMLEHVVEREILDQIVRAVDMVIRVLESRLDDEGRGVAGLGGRRVIGAGVAALGLHEGDVAVLLVGQRRLRNVRAWKMIHIPQQ